MKIVDPHFDQREMTYVAFMAESLKAVPREKIPPTTTQSASTQAILARDPSQDEHHFNRPNPLNWKANPDAKTKDEAVGMRALKPDEIVIVENIRRKGRNSLGDAVSMGARSVTEESINRAIEAFTYAPAAELTYEEKLKLQALTPYSPLPPAEPEPVKSSWFSRFLPKKKEIRFKLVAGKQVAVIDDD